MVVAGSTRSKYGAVRLFELQALGIGVTHRVIVLHLRGAATCSGCKETIISADNTDGCICGAWYGCISI